MFRDGGKQPRLSRKEELGHLWGRRWPVGRGETRGLCWGAEVLTPLSCCRCWCCFWPAASHCRKVKRMQHGNLSSVPTAGDHSPQVIIPVPPSPVPWAFPHSSKHPEQTFSCDWLDLVKPCLKRGRRYG